MIDDGRLDEILASIGAALVVESEPAPPHRRLVPRRPLVLAAAAVLVAVAVVVAVGVVVTPARDALGGWLRVGRTQIHADVDVALPIEALPGFVETAPPLAPSAAAAVLGAPLPDLARTALGAPMAWLEPAEGGVIAVWPDATTTLWLLPLAPGGEMWFDKTVASARQVTEVAGLGERAVAVTGDHVLQTPLRRVTAATTVLWIDGQVSYRLESDRPLDELVSLARTVAAAA